MTANRSHPVLQLRPGESACLLGNVAIVRGALEAGVQFFACYPGTPSSEVGDTFAQINEQAEVLFEYSINEKIAVEIAFAASLAGARTMCSMKHLGLNYAGDPISTMPYVGVEGGMVIVSAGDPSLMTSPNEQDQRHFSGYLFYPTFDPATPKDAHEMTRFAFRLSEETRLPILLRPTTRVCHTSGMVEPGPLPERKNPIEFRKNPPRYVPVPDNARRMRKELSERFARAEGLLARSKFFPRTGHGPRGIVASGVAYTYVKEVLRALGLEQKVSLLQIGAYPVSETILRPFLDSVESVLVVEELTPFVEDLVIRSAYQNRRLIPINGKYTGHLPTEFEYDLDIVEEAVQRHLGVTRRRRPSPPVPDLPARPPVLCPGCPHRASFYAARKVFGNSTVYHNDIGCYTLGYGIPLDTCDVLLSMGSSISQAAGVARVTGRRTVAFIGDSTFFHSGLPALANAVKADDPVTVFILNNGVTAMTGFQPSFAAADRGPASLGLSIEDAVRGLGVRQLDSVNPFDTHVMLEILTKLRDAPGLNVVVCNAPCAVQKARDPTADQKAPASVDQDRCGRCGHCVRVLGCPAIQVDDDRYLISDDICDGCGLCAEVCPVGAISRDKSGEPLLATSSGGQPAPTADQRETVEPQP